MLRLRDSCQRASGAVVARGKVAGTGLAGACLVAALLALGNSSAAAQQVGKIAYDSYTLPNGLTVVFSEDHTTPIVTVNVWYHVGSANERAHRSGFAHLFEHMMFQGSAHVKKSEHMQLVERAGGSMNGSTTEDRTNYFETVPSNRLNLGLWLEADRMRSLAINQTNFENQRQTVKEERRLGVDNRPYGKAFLEALTLPYDSSTCFAYAHTVIGDMADLDSAKVEDVQAFFNQFYAPNNAVLTVAGDFDPAEARSLIQQYFGDIPKVSDAAPVTCEARYSTGERRLEQTDSLANLPLVALIYKVPQRSEADAPALELLASVLGDGESSRLNLRLVRQDRLAVNAGSFADFRRRSGAMMVLAINNQGIPAAQVERVLNEEIDKVRNDTITQAELTKVQNQYRRGAIRERQTTMGVAEALQGALWFDGSLEAANEDVQRHLAVTVADMKRVAQQYLVPANRLTLIVNPPASKGGASQ